MFSDFGRPQTDFSGTIAVNCASVSGNASGSAFAARRIFRFSASVGMAITRLGVVFNIVFDLSAFGVAKADDSTCLATINKCHVVQTVAFWDESDHAKFVVLVAFIDPYESFFPGEPPSERQRQTMVGNVDPVFGRVEVDAHALV